MFAYALPSIPTHFQAILIENQSHPIGIDSTSEKGALFRCGSQTDSEIVMLDGTFFGDSFKQDRSWDDSGTTISGI